MIDSQTASPTAPSTPAVTRLRSLEGLFNPASVAVVGASQRHGSIVETVQASHVRTWLVNPKRTSVLGTACYHDLASLPETPDTAIIVVGASSIEQATDDVLSAGVRAVVIPGIGAEAGRDAHDLTQRVLNIASRHNAAVLGVNCMGYAQPNGPSLWLGTLPPQFRPGHVSVISQSGSVAEALMTTGPRIGFRTVVSSGNELNRDCADLLAFFAKDPGTRAIGLFLETVRRPAEFSQALRLCREANKPVVCLKVGRSTVASSVALTHTGAMVGSSTAFSTFLRAYDVIEVRDIPELVETLEILGHQRWPNGFRVGAVSESGGEAGLLADLAEEAGLDMAPLPLQTASELSREFPNFSHPHNPIDAWAIDSVDAVFPRCFELMRKSDAYDILVAQVDLTRYRSSEDNEWCAQIVQALADATRDMQITPVVISVNCVEAPDELAELALNKDIALLRGIRSATIALSAVARWSSRHARSTQPTSIYKASPRLPVGSLSEFDSANLLSTFGVAFSAYRRASSPLEAGQLAEELGFPVVIKMDGPAHKSVIGGVALGITCVDEAVIAAKRMGGSVLASHQIPSGLEVICGMQRDTAFGPILSVGLGGVLAEAIGVVSTALAPVDDDEARRLLVAVPGLATITTSDVMNQLITIVRAVSTLSIEHPEIDSIDLNPVVIGKDSAVAVDALVVVGNNSGHSI
ncbi:MAG: acetate--CoA ligase family protein [Ferrimicrobium sp.]